MADRQVLHRLLAAAGPDREAFVDLARHTEPWGETFSMPIAGHPHLRPAQRRLGAAWPGRPPDVVVPVARPAEDQVPIGHITNGVHTGTWLARRTALLFDRYFDADWRKHV